MRVLLTNNTLDIRGGSELYVRDIAVELMRRGHQPVAYSTKLGAVADELRSATIPVIDHLSALADPPDIIHGQHHYETFSALLRFPDTPAIYFCHGWLPWQEATLRHPNIVRYVAVDHLCRERLITEGAIAPDKVDVVLNFFDQRLFPQRPALPASPKRALVFGNDFTKHAGLSALAEACSRCGIELDMRGLGIENTIDQPGVFLAGYDIVFAKARAAIEAMAVGAAVVLFGHGRLGPMVTTANFSSLRPWNFGIRTLSMPLDVDLAAAELQKYNCEDALEVSRIVRTTCELQSAADRIIDIYRNVLIGGLPVHSQGPVHAADYLEQWAGHYKNCFEVLSDRDRWVARCHAAEQTLSQREEQLREHQSVIEDRQRWVDRCLAAEAALSKSERLRKNEADQTSQVRNLLDQREAETAGLIRQLSDVRSSATWRWSQRFLQSSPIQLLFGGLIRSVAERNHL